MNRVVEPIGFGHVSINDSFWNKKQRLVTEISIPYQEKILNDEISGAEKSHAFANFRIAAGMEEGEFYGMVFQDSDVAKWIEASAYSLTIAENKELEEKIDKVIDSIAKAQQPDGYLNTYFTLKDPEHRYQNLFECHELYCSGHMMEAAAAYYEVTGKKKLLEVMERVADNIISHFGVDKEYGIPGHSEIELGLIRLYRATGKQKYLEEAKYFLDERGTDPEWFEKEQAKRKWVHFGLDPKDTKYNQSFAPVRKQKTAEGHAVRAMYLYTAMAALASETGDQDMLKACETLWDNVVNKRMYVTGGIGSNAEGEAFTIDYDLPNDSVYAETCASVGLVFFSKQMLDITADGKYGDIIELELYNGVLSGMQLDGKHFFYVNPLEVNPGVSGELFGYKHVLPERPGWYACACCPPNVLRLISSLGKYIWGENADTIFSNLFVGGSANLDKANVEMKTEFPWNGAIRYTIHSKTNKAFSFAIRIPEYVTEYKIQINGEDVRGCVKKSFFYLNRVWGENDCVEVSFEFPVKKVYANSHIRADAGCVALKRGPVVYCFEGVDNGENLQALSIRRESAWKPIREANGILEGCVILAGDGVRTITSDKLYSTEPPVYKNVKLKAIPYYTWGNRGKNQMRVWLHEIE